jgi:hypothetical protein
LLKVNEPEAEGHHGEKSAHERQVKHEVSIANVVLATASKSLFLIAGGHFFQSCLLSSLFVLAILLSSLRVKNDQVLVKWLIIETGHVFKGALGLSESALSVQISGRLWKSNDSVHSEHTDENKVS